MKRRAFVLGWHAWGYGALVGAVPVRGPWRARFVSLLRWRSRTAR